MADSGLMTGSSVDLCSVVIPTHNRRERLIKTLATIQAQTFEPLEIVISDDGSSDGTMEAIEELSDDRIVITRSEESAGVARARNAGLAVASGRWISFCDDDDFWHPDKISNQVNAMELSDARWAVSGVIGTTDQFELVGAGFSPHGIDFREGILFANRVRGGCSNVIVERSLLDEVGGFDPDLSMIADWDLWLRFSAVEDPAFTDSFDLLYVHHPDQMSTNMVNTARELAYFREKHAQLRANVEPPPYERIDAWIVRRLWRAGQYRDATRFAARSQGRLGPAHGFKGIAIEIVKGRLPSASRSIGQQFSMGRRSSGIDWANTKTVIEEVRSIVDCAVFE